jgi:hypothetical protein
MSFIISPTNGVQSIVVEDYGEEDTILMKLVRKLSTLVYFNFNCFFYLGNGVRKVYYFR